MTNKDEPIYHSLERTSPKGGPFRGYCVNCGEKDLPSSAVFDPCPNPLGQTLEETLINAIQGPKPI